MENLKGRFARYREVKLTVIGRKSGKGYLDASLVCVEGDALYLLPVHGSDTQWYRSVLKTPKIRIEAKGAEAGSVARPIKKSREVESVVDNFGRSTERRM